MCHEDFYRCQCKKTGKKLGHFSFFRGKIGTFGQNIHPWSGVLIHCSHGTNRICTKSLVEDMLMQSQATLMYSNYINERYRNSYLPFTFHKKEGPKKRENQVLIILTKSMKQFCIVMLLVNDSKFSQNHHL